MIAGWAFSERAITAARSGDRLLNCSVDLSNPCNLNCPYCMSRTSSKPKAPELSTSEIKRLIIDEVKKYCSHPAMAFSGGEFLLREDALELLDYTASRGMWSFINTNAVNLDKKAVRKIKEATGNKVIFVFSLNSLESKINEWSRNDSLNTVVKAARLCAGEKINFFFISTVSKSNLHTFKETVNFLKSKGIPVLRSPFVLRGSGRQYSELLFSSQDMENIIHPVLRDYHLSYVSYVPFFAGPENLEAKQKRMNVSIGQFGCQAAKGFVGINPEGEVAPCVQLLDSEVRCGNVRETPLLTILTTNDLLIKLRKRETLKGKCGICRYKHTCGGCRAFTYYKTGDYLESDPSCFFNPEDENTISEHEKLQSENADKFLDFISKREPWKSLFNSGNETVPGARKALKPHKYVASKVKKYFKGAVGMITGK